MIEALLKAGAEVNAKLDEGRTLLGVAMAKRNPRVIKAMLRVPGTDDEVRDDQGATPLHSVVNNGVMTRGDVVNELLPTGADPNVEGQRENAAP